MKQSIATLLLLACTSARPEPATPPPPPTSTASHVATDPPAAHGSQRPGPEHEHEHGYAMDFSEVERFARHFDDPARDAWQKPAELVRLMAIEPGQVVADLGAGTGYFVRYFSAAVGDGGRVIALDIEPNMVEYVKRCARDAGWKNVEARVVPAKDPGLGPASVDRVLIVNTWHHIGDRSAYARKLARALKPGGAIWIVDFTRESDLGPPPEHRISPEQVIAELVAGGLRAELVGAETLPKQYVIVGRVSN